MIKIGIIGHIADGYDFYDGQTISTRLLRDEINARIEHKIFEVDTYFLKRNPIIVLARFFVCMCTCTHVIIMLSRNGLKFFLPIIHLFNKVSRKKIYHRVIGGSIDSLIEKNANWVKYLSSIEVNWVQSSKIVDALNKRGIMNAKFLPNFRNITPIRSEDIGIVDKEPLKFCTFSRVSESKGIGDAIESIRRINEKHGKIIATLDIFGPIEEEYRNSFIKKVEENSEYVKYKGSIPSKDAVKVLKNYYYLLFPTTWSGEGFPGAVIDCYNAALPIIATNWAYNSEVIIDGKTGFIYDFNDKEGLEKKIEYVINHREDNHTLRHNCLDEAKKYSSSIVIKQIFSDMNLNNYANI